MRYGMTSAKQLIVCLFGCLAMVAWAPDARSEEIPGFAFDGITGTVGNRIPLYY